MKEYLEKYRHVDRKIDICRSEIEQIKTLITGITSIRYDIEKIQKTKSTEAPFSKYVLKLITLEDEIHKDLNELIDIRVKLKKEIELYADEKKRLLLHYRYIEGLSWKEIALKFGVNERTVLRWHKEI